MRGRESCILWIPWGRDRACLLCIPDKGYTCTMLREINAMICFCYQRRLPVYQASSLKEIPGHGPESTVKPVEPVLFKTDFHSEKFLQLSSRSYMKTGGIHWGTSRHSRCRDTVQNLVKTGYNGKSNIPVEQKVSKVSFITLLMIEKSRRWSSYVVIDRPMQKIRQTVNILGILHRILSNFFRIWILSRMRQREELICSWNRALGEAWRCAEGVSGSDVDEKRKYGRCRGKSEDMEGNRVDEQGLSSQWKQEEGRSKTEVH